MSKIRFKFKKSEDISKYLKKNVKKLLKLSRNCDKMSKIRLKFQKIRRKCGKIWKMSKVSLICQKIRRKCQNWKKCQINSQKTVKNSLRMPKISEK